MLYNSRRKKNQRGQAITELAISLIAIVMVLLGLLLISALGIENVRNVMLAREDADHNAARNIESNDNGHQIVEWDYGTDGIPFTSDDVPDTITQGDGYTFSSELIDNNAVLDLRSTLNGTAYIQPANNFAPNLSDLNIFVNAATLSVGRGTEHDPLGKRKLGDLKAAINNLIVRADFTLEDKAYMPARAEQVNNKY